MAMLPANQLFIPLKKWPFQIPDRAGGLPAHTGVSELEIKKWFYRVRYWELAVSGTYTIATPDVTFVATYSGTQIIPAQKLTAYGEEEAWETAELTEPRDIWKMLNLYVGEEIVNTQWGHYIQGAAYVLLEQPWGLEASVTQIPDEGDPVTHDPVTVGESGLFTGGFFPVRKNPLDHDEFYPLGFLQLTNGFMQGIATDDPAIVSPGTQVGTYTIDGAYQMPICVNGSLISGYDYSGDIVATLSPATTDGFWPWGEIGTGDNPRYDSTTGEKTANW